MYFGTSSGVQTLKLLMLRERERERGWGRNYEAYLLSVAYIKFSRMIHVVVVNTVGQSTAVKIFSHRFRNSDKTVKHLPPSKI